MKTSKTSAKKAYQRKDRTLPFKAHDEKTQKVIDWHMARFMCLNDLFYLTKYILGYEGMTESFHRPLCELVSGVNPLIIRQAGKDSPLSFYSDLFNLSLKDGNLLFVSHYDKRTYKQIKPSAFIQKGNVRNDSQSNELVINDLESIVTTDAPISYDLFNYRNNFFPESNSGVGGVEYSYQPTTQNSTTFSGEFHKETYTDLDNQEKGLKWNSANYAEHSILDQYLEESKGARERLWLMFRGSFKTTVITIAHTIQLMLLWPDIRILISSHKKEGGSQEILGAIRQHFKANKTFRSLWPEYCPKPNTVGQIEFGTTERVTLPNRSPECAWPESTIEIAGLTTDVTGRHYDYIKNDDLVTRDSVTNETMIQKTRQFKALQKFLFNQPEWGIMDNIGTFYHFNDIYNTLRKSKGITKLVVPIVRDDQIEPEKWEPTLPERFTSKGCYELKTDPSMTLQDWNNQYMLNPIPPEDQIFRPEWFERLGFFYQPEEILNKTLRVRIFVDPANKKKKKSDYTAMIALGVDADGTIFLLDIIRDKLNVEERTNLAISLVRKYNERSMWYETIGFQDTDKYIIDKKCRESGYYIIVNEIAGQSGRKEDRIAGLQPIYQLGNIRWPEHYWYYSKYEKVKLDMIELLKDEFLMFPKCEHDDMLDCHQMMLRAPEFKPSKKKEEKQDDLFEQLRKLTIEHKRGVKFQGFGKKRTLQGIPAFRSLPVMGKRP